MPKTTPTPQQLVEAILTVPDEVRAFQCGADDAERIFGIAGPLLDRLTTLGLPFKDGRSGRRYSHADLHYLGLRLGTAVFHLRTFDAWAQRIQAKPGLDRTRLRIRYVPRLPQDQASCEGSVLLPDGRLSAVLYDKRPAADITVTPRWDWPRIDPRVAAAAEDLAATDHYIFDVPTDVHPDSVVMDCVLAARALLATCQQLGYEARWAFGIIAAPMFSLHHCWVEVATDGVWVPVDSVILGLLRRFQNLTATDWPATESLGGLLIRLSDDVEAVVADRDGRWLNYSLFTTTG